MNDRSECIKQNFIFREIYEEKAFIHFMFQKMVIQKGEKILADSDGVYPLRMDEAGSDNVITAQIAQSLIRIYGTMAYSGLCRNGLFRVMRWCNGLFRLMPQSLIQPYGAMVY